MIKPLLVYFIILILTAMASPLRQVIQCKCGKVKLALDAPSALRIVCYSRDYRGYYQTLNDQAVAKKQPANAKLDAWGGVDLTQIYVRLYCVVLVFFYTCCWQMKEGLIFLYSVFFSFFFSQARSRCNKETTPCSPA